MVALIKQTACNGESLTERYHINHKETTSSSDAPQQAEEGAGGSPEEDPSENEVNLALQHL